MDRVGVSFQSELSADDVMEKYIRPLRAAIEMARAGFYSNYLRQADADPAAPAEHLLMFEAYDFPTALRILRLELQRLGPPGEVRLHNLNPSDPAY